MHLLLIDDVLQLLGNKLALDYVLVYFSSTINGTSPILNLSLDEKNVW